MMKSINQKEQAALDKRVKGKLSLYIKKLDHSAKAVMQNPQKVKKVVAALKKNGKGKLADELAIATSRDLSESEIIEKMSDDILSNVITGDKTLQKKDVEAVKFEVAKIAVEAVQGFNDMVSSRFLYEGTRKARTVGRISKLEGPEPIGTGFMISPDLMMTNHHVLKNKEEAEDCYIEFDYYHSKDSTRVNSEIFKIRPDGFYHSNPDYDYAIVMVDAISDQQKDLSYYGWNDLSSKKIDVKTSDRLNIVHHPKGEHQRISIRKNYVVDIDNKDQFVDYVTDTDYGSSGSPVYDDEWNIIALHMGNVTIKDENDRSNFLRSLNSISKDLADEMKDKKITVNVGVKINFILEDLKIASINMPEVSQKLIDRIFDYQKAENELTSPNISNDNISSMSLQENQDFPSIAPTINISGGNVTLNLAHNITETKQKNQPDSRAKKPSSKVDKELYKKSLTSQTSIFKALDYVQMSRELPYLPSPEKLEIIQQDYYGNIVAEAQNMTSTEFFEVLSKKMHATFTLVDSFPAPLDLEDNLQEESSTPSSYHKARAHIYTRVDLQPDGSLKGIYSNAVIAPEQLLLVDLINSLKSIDYKLPKRYKNSDYLNCEHIVPKTYFKRKEAGFSDLHHLITADGAINKFRNKNTFADLNQEGDDGRSRIPHYISSGGWKKGKHFEPARGKGLVARATLYFFVAHPHFISSDIYSSAQVKTLIKWSNAEAPSDYEKHRNQTIFEVQGNRNPFIDFPEWVDMVDFSRGIK